MTFPALLSQSNRSGFETLRMEVIDESDPRLNPTVVVLKLIRVRNSIPTMFRLNPTVVVLKH